MFKRGILKNKILLIVGELWRINEEFFVNAFFKLKMLRLDAFSINRVSCRPEESRNHRGERGRSNFSRRRFSPL